MSVAAKHGKETKKPFSLEFYNSSNLLFFVTSQNSWMNILFVVQKRIKPTNSRLLRTPDHLSRMLPQTTHFWPQNMSCLHPIRTCFFFATCTHLDATNGTTKNKIVIMNYIYPFILTKILNTGASNPIEDTVCSYFSHKWLIFPQ